MSSPVGRRIDLIEWRSLGDLTSLLEQTFLNDACDLWSDFRHEGSNDASWQFGRDGDGLRMQPDNADMGACYRGVCLVARSGIAAGKRKDGRDRADHQTKIH